MVKNIREQIDDLGGVNSGGRIKLFAHSQGGLILDVAKKYLTKEERAMIDVITVGSARQAQRGDWKSAQNYISSRDGVPMLDVKNYGRALLGKMPNTTFLNSGWGIPFVDHAFQGDTYTTQLKQTCDKIIEGYRL